MTPPALILAVVLSRMGSQADVRCQPVEITTPPAGSSVAETRPVVMWSAVPGVRSYRMQIESRVANGPALVSLDTHVEGTRFEPPQRLTDFRAIVKVLVTSGCPPDDGGQLRSQPASFFIDTTPLCAGPARIDRSENAHSIQWAPTPHATRYDVTLLRPDGTLVARGQTHGPAFALPAGPAGNDALVAVVRPFCNTGFGAYAAALISAGQD